jgi:3D (Asp-Asp-Asp) domain-containing protein
MTEQVTVEAALEEAGVEVNEADVIVPPLESDLTPGMHVYIEYAQRIELDLGVKTVEVYTNEETLGAALSEAGYELEAGDGVFPAADTPVVSGMTAGLSMLRDATVEEDEAIGHATVYKYDYHMDEGQERIEEPGSDGYIRRQYAVIRYNGEEISRRFVSETRVEPSASVVTIGIRAIRSAAGEGTYPGQDAAPPNGELCAATPHVWATYYTAVSAGGTVTRTGTGVYKGIIATDPNYIPLGTRMYVPGYGYGLAADTGGGVHGWHVDLAYGANDVYDWGSRYLDICILD